MRVSLADVLRHVTALKRRPEADIKAEILEALRSRRLPHRAKRIVEYLPRVVTPSPGRRLLYPAGAPPQEPPPTQVNRDAQIPKEVLTIGVSGRGALHVDWLNSRMLRRAGASWSRIEVEDVTSDQEQMLEIWPSGKTELRVALKEILRELFPPDGTLPTKHPRKVLEGQVNTRLEARGMPATKIRTILRVAGVGKP
jgi:hypothetical protein